jgi:hypothetical protein
MNQEVTDQVVLAVMAKYAERSNVGLKEIRSNFRPRRPDLSMIGLNTLSRRLWISTLYLERIRKEMKP